jgi:hypothetical protein
MDAWTTDLPTTPGHYWVRLPGYERAPDIEHVDDRGDGLIVFDEHVRAWRSLVDVWGNSGASSCGPLVPPDV